MALKDIGERLEGKGWLGVGLGAVVLAPVVIPALSRTLRPAAKNAIKGYLALSDRARHWMAETGEQWQDLVAEAKSEHETGVNGSEMMTMELASESQEGAAGGQDEATAEEKPAEEGKEEGKEEGRSRSRRRTQAEAA